MIKANELRTGNKVNSPKHNINNATVVALLPEANIVTLREVRTYDNFDEIEPIPLTPEWIEKLDLQFNTGYEFAKIFNLYIEYGEPNCHVCIEQYSEGREPLPDIKYVHQLQNVFIDLIGRELKTIEK